MRALTPHHRPYLLLGEGAEERLGVREAIAEQGAGAVAAGSLVGEGDAIVLGCSPGELRIAVVQPPGARAMSATDYLRGHSLPATALVG